MMIYFHLFFSPFPRPELRSGFFLPGSGFVIFFRNAVVCNTLSEARRVIIQNIQSFVQTLVRTDYCEHWLA